MSRFTIVSVICVAVVVGGCLVLDDDKPPCPCSSPAGEVISDQVRLLSCADPLLFVATFSRTPCGRFERRYPGRTRSSARGDDGGEDDVLDRDRFSADDIGYRKQQPSQQQQQQQRGKPRTRRDGDVEYDGGGSRDAPPAGYYREEDEYDY